MGDSILEERSEEQILWERYIRTKDVRTEEALVRRFMPLVDRVVGRVASRLPSFVSQEELRSYGYVGLLEAVRKYEPERGISFSTYAMWRIRGAIYDGLRDLDPYTRSLREKSKKVEEIQSFLEQKHLRRVDDEEIASEANLSPREVARLRREEPESSFPELEDDEGQKLPLPWSDPNAPSPRKRRRETSFETSSPGPSSAFPSASVSSFPSFTTKGSSSTRLPTSSGCLLRGFPSFTAAPSLACAPSWSAT